MTGLDLVPGRSYEIGARTTSKIGEVMTFVGRKDNSYVFKDGNGKRREVWRLSLGRVLREV